MLSLNLTISHDIFLIRISLQVRKIYKPRAVAWASRTKYILLIIVFDDSQSVSQKIFFIMVILLNCFPITVT